MCHARVRVRCGQGRLGYGLIRSWNVFPTLEAVPKRRLESLPSGFLKSLVRFFCVPRSGTISPEIKMGSFRLGAGGF